MSEKWKKVCFEIVKYALGAILGAVGMTTASGCSCVPVITL